MLASLLIYSTGYILRKATPPFGKLAAEEGKRHGQLRAAHARLITSSEEVAFYGYFVVSVPFRSVPFHVVLFYSRCISLPLHLSLSSRAQQHILFNAFVC